MGNNYNLQSFNWRPFMNFCARWNMFDPQGCMGNAIWGATLQTGWFPGWSVVSPEYQKDYYESWRNATASTVQLSVTPSVTPSVTQSASPDSTPRTTPTGTPTANTEFNTLKTKLTNLKAKITDATKRSEVEQAITEAKTVEELEAVLETHKDVFAIALSESKKDNITKVNDTSLHDEVKALNKALNGVVLIEGEKPTYDFSSVLSDGEWKSEIDILDLISTWNSSLSGTDKKHIMVAIKEAYDQAKQADNNDGVAKIKALADSMHNKLIEEADSLYNNVNLENISEEEKDALTRLKNGLSTAKAELETFNETPEKFNDAIYSDAFNNLYRMIRIVEARNEDAQIKAELDSESELLLDKTNSDLSSENIQKKDLKTKVSVREDDGKVKEEDVDSDVVKQRRAQGFIQTEFADIWSKGGKYYYDKDGNTLKELVGVTKIEKDGDVIKCYYNNGITKTIDDAKAIKREGQIKIGNEIYNVVVKDGVTKFVRQSDKVELTEQDLGISNVAINEDGSYTYSSGGVNYKSTKEHALEIYTPEQAQAEVESSTKGQIKIGNEIYNVVVKEGVTKYVRQIDNVELTEQDLGISNVTINEDGSYTYTAGGVNYKSTKDHNLEIVT